VATGPSLAAPPVHQYASPEWTEKQAETWDSHEGKELPRRCPGKAHAQYDAKQEVPKHRLHGIVVLAIPLLFVIRKWELEKQLEEPVEEQLKENLNNEFKDLQGAPQSSDQRNCYSPAMPTLTDAELKQLMKQLARIEGLNLSDERVDHDLVAFKGHIAATEKIRAVPLPLEAEPFVKLKR
jgi:hypothetical protein